MNSGSKAAEWHPGPEVLALYSRHDLPLTERWRLARHVKGCPECRRQVLLFASAHADLNREAQQQTLTGFEAIADWPRLELEMLGNIAVGVSAARCIEKVGHKRIWIVRCSLAAAFSALFVVGWITHIPGSETHHLTTSVRRLFGLEPPPFAGTILQNTADGIAVQTRDATLTILHPSSAVVMVSGPSAISARYVDEDSGEVTIAKVYAQ